MLRDKRFVINCPSVSADIREYVPKLDLIHVQADEIRVKVAWMGFAMVVSTRLWLCEVVGRTRDKRLADPMQQQFQASSHAACGLCAVHFFAPSACLSIREEKVCLPQRY